MRRHVSPQDWIGTSVSRPLTVVVVYGPPPPRTSRHTGALLPGCVTARSCCAFTRSSGACASTALAIVSDSNRNSHLISRSPLAERALPVNALILVLCEL